LISSESILALAEQHLKDGPVFVTGVKITPANDITVFIDGDEGVKIEDCVSLSRAIEANLDRDREDFSLNVSSHGAASPLIMPRQYRRHIGREFELKLADGSKAEGRLSALDEDGLMIEWEERENKPIGKGKHTVKKERKISFSDIKEGRIKLKF
jgi:ribosome maturation factor RimP